MITAMPSPAVPVSPVPAPVRAPLGGLVAGVLSSQIVNNALHIIQPLLIAELSGSLALAAVVASAETGVHMLGTLVSGGTTDRLGSRMTLILATAGRAVSLSIVPVAWAMGVLTLPVALAAYTLDALVRGWIDTAVHALPLGLADGDRAELDRLNASYEFAFDLAAVIGPLLLGALLLGKKGFAAHAAIPVGFALAALLYTLVPARLVGPAKSRGEKEPKWLDWNGWRRVSSDKALLAPVLGLALFNLFPLRKVWSAFFAKAVLNNAASAGWIGAAFGAGGVVGAVLYAKAGRRLSTRGWVLCGAFGTAALAVAWIPGALWPMIAGAATFGLFNACAELSLLRDLGEHTPAGMMGRVVSVARVGTSTASVSLKGLMAGAFAVGAGAYAAFGLVGAGLGAMALLQVAVASRLSRR
jgi:MFS family permease